MGGPGSGRRKGTGGGKVKKKTKENIKYTHITNKHKKSLRGGSTITIRDYKTGGWKNY